MCLADFEWYAHRSNRSDLLILRLVLARFPILSGTWKDHHHLIDDQLSNEELTRYLQQRKEVSSNFEIVQEHLMDPLAASISQRKCSGWILCHTNLCHEPTNDELIRYLKRV